MEWLDAIIQGVLLGGLYALFATGLSLIFGVMRLVNIAHGDLIVLSAFLGLAMVNGTGVHPLLSLVVTIPVMAGIGYALQRGILNLTLGRDILPPLLVTFGLSIIIQNVLLEVFSADTQRLKAGALETASIAIGDQIAIGWFPLIVFLSAVGVIAGLQLVLFRTRLGAAFRATSDDHRDRGTDGHRQPPRLRARDGAGACGGRARRHLHGDPHQLLARHRAGSAALRLRGGDHRRAGQPVGHARRRRNPGRGPGHRRQVPSWRADSRRARRLPDRARAPAQRALS